MSRDAFDRFTPPDRGRFGDNETRGSERVEKSNLCDLDLYLRNDNPDKKAIALSPFLVTREQSDKSKLYAVRESDGEILWEPRRREATQFTEADADAVADAINRYAPDMALVVGCR